MSVIGNKLRAILKNKYIVSAGAILGAVFAVYYIGNQGADILSEPLDYEVAVAITTEDAIEAECFIMREEQPITSRSIGIVIPAVEDGERVARGANAVKVYSNRTDADNHNTVREIDRRVAVLENSRINTSTVETKPERIDDEIELLLEDAVIAVSDNDLKGAIDVRDELLIQMNKRWLYSTNGSGFDEQVKSLLATKSTLAPRLLSAGETVTADVAGYYYSEVDGYEEIFDCSNLSNMTLDAFEVMVSTPPAAYAGNICGKLVTDHIWYAACKVTTDKAYHFDVGKGYDVEFTSSGTVIPMELAYKIEENSSNDAVMIFKTSTLPKDFKYVRKQPIRLVYNSYSGLRIPKETVRVVNGVKGVYVTGGTTVRFKMINDIYSFDDYHIVDANADNYPKVEKSRVINEDGTEKVTYYPVLSLYDRVIVGTDELYDGMELK